MKPGGEEGVVDGCGKEEGGLEWVELVKGEGVTELRAAVAAERDIDGALRGEVVERQTRVDQVALFPLLSERMRFT